ncbi:hypothetical protein B0H11DRAFT_1909941 [Mycena galericulata]|nr:hypothetical protein B0H11DRAFT_1909941 [Mycena galericulata]
MSLNNVLSRMNWATLAWGAPASRRNFSSVKPDFLKTSAHSGSSGTDLTNFSRNGVCGRGGDAALPRRLTRRSKLGDHRSHVLKIVATMMANQVVELLALKVGRGGHAAGRGNDAANAAKCMVTSPRPLLLDAAMHDAALTILDAALTIIDAALTKLDTALTKLDTAHTTLGAAIPRNHPQSIVPHPTLILFGLDDPNLRFSRTKYEQKPSHDGGKRLSVQSARRDAAKCTVAPRQYFCADPAIERADAHQNHWLNYLENGNNRTQLKGQNVVARWKIHSLSLTWFTIIWSALWLEIWRLRDVRRDAAKYPMAPRPYFCADLAVESAQAVKTFWNKKAGMLHYGASVKSLRPKNGQSNAAKFKLATWRRPTSPTANIVVYFQPTSSQSNDERRKRQTTQVQPWESGSTYRHL